MTAVFHHTPKKNGLNCLLTEKGSVILEGYKEGFIGGCCGMIAPDLLAVAGSLEYHKSGRDIIMFCRKYGVNIAELYDGPLLDIGGIVPAACNNLL